VPQAPQALPGITQTSCPLARQVGHLTPGIPGISVTPKDPEISPNGVGSMEGRMSISSWMMISNGVDWKDMLIEFDKQV